VGKQRITLVMLASLFSLAAVGPLEAQSPPGSQSSQTRDMPTQLGGRSTLAKDEQIASDLRRSIDPTSFRASASTMTILRWNNQTCYIPEQFKSVVQQGYSKIVANMKSQELTPLHAYVDSYFEALRKGAPPIQRIPQWKGNGPFSSYVLGVDKGLADSVIQKIYGLYQKLAQIDPLTLDLSVKSQPTGATFSIQVGQDAISLRSISTDDKMLATWRGLYTATVSKSGYQTLTYPFDLVDDSRSEISCTLVISNQTGSGVCARLSH